MKKIIILALIATLFTGCVAKQTNDSSKDITETNVAVISTEETTTDSTTETPPAETTAVTPQETNAVTTLKAKETTSVTPAAISKTAAITTALATRQATAPKTITTTKVPVSTSTRVIATTPKAMADWRGSPPDSRRHKGHSGSRAHRSTSVASHRKGRSRR